MILLYRLLTLFVRLRTWNRFRRSPHVSASWLSEHLNKEEHSGLDLPCIAWPIDKQRNEAAE